MKVKRPRGNPNIREVGHSTRFKPGNRVNPGGKRPRLSITRLVRDELERPTAEGSNETKAEAVAARIVAMAQAGDHGMVKLVWAYTDGEPKQSSEMTLRELAEQLAERMGLDPNELMAAFERDLGAA